MTRAAVLRRLAPAALAVAVQGCATPGEQPPSDAAEAPVPAPAAPAAVARTRIAPGQTGLEVITWQVTDEGRRVSDALLAHAAPAVARVDEIALRRNGLILWAVRADALDTLRDSLGGSPLDVHTWLGTATTWRELASVPTGDSLLEIDGIAKERRPAQARLMVRSWPVPMEDGTRVSVQLVPQLVTGAAEASLVRNGNRLAGEVIRSCTIDLELEPGVAWALTCDPGGFVETDAEAPARAAEERAVMGPPSPDRPAASGKIGSRVVTLGASLLLAAPERTGAPSRRTVLLFVPHLGGSAFPDAAGGAPMNSPAP